MHDVMELAEGFVDYKRSLGYVYPKQTVDLARQMARHLLEMPSDVVVTREAAESFSMRRDGEAASTQNKRASIIRQFSIYLQHIGIDCYVPEEGRGRRPQSDFAPRIISESEMARVIEAADAWPVKCRMRGFREAYASLIRLLWCCGLRLGEALSLRIADVDLEVGAITVRRAKHNRTRVLPLSKTMSEHLSGYMASLAGDAPDAYLFPGATGGRRNRSAASLQIKKVMAAAGVTGPGGSTPRTHDIRHSYAVCVLGKMQEDGVDVRCALPLLSTYMGHSDITSTELYLRLPEGAHQSIHDAMSGPYEELFPEVRHAE